MQKNIFGIVSIILLFIAFFLSQSLPALALQGTAGGPCMPPHDAPTVGNYHGGDQNLQTYSAQSGRTVTRLCMATRLSNGKVDHSSFYQNYDSECYQISGLGSSKVTIKRVSETYQVPSWQTGPEAGKCAPLEHLDLFLSAEPSTTPAPASSPSPTTTITTVSPSPTASPTNQVKAVPTLSTPRPTVEASQIPVVKKNSKVLGEDTEQEGSSSGQVNQLGRQNNWNWWWLSGLLLPLIFVIIWWRRKK